MTDIYVTGYFLYTIDFGGVTLTGRGGALNIFVAKYDLKGNIEWAERAGGNDIDYGQSICIDKIGDVFTTGFFHGSADFGPDTIRSKGTEDAFISKYSPSGNFDWTEHGGGNSSTFGQGIALDLNDNVYVTGLFNKIDLPNPSGDPQGVVNFGGIILRSADSGDIFVAKYHSDSTIEWAIRAGGTSNNDIGNAIAIDNYGSIYVTGSFESKARFLNDSLMSAGGTDIFLWKIGTDTLQFDTSYSFFSVIKPKTLILIDDDSGYPGDHRSIPMILENAPISSVQSLATNFSARVAYDNSVLSPDSGVVQKGNLFDTVSVAGSLKTSDTLIFIPFTALLGERTFTSLNIVDFNWLDGTGNPVDYDVETKSGTFTVLNGCGDSLLRNFMLTGKMAAITSISPNPSNSITHIEIQTTEKGRTQLEVMNLLGLKVATIWNSELQTGSHSFDFKTSDLLSGSYFLVMTTPTVRKMARIDVAK